MMNIKTTLGIGTTALMLSCGALLSSCNKQKEPIKDNELSVEQVDKILEETRQYNDSVRSIYKQKVKQDSIDMVEAWQAYNSINLKNANGIDSANAEYQKNLAEFREDVYNDSKLKLLKLNNRAAIDSKGTMIDLTGIRLIPKSTNVVECSITDDIIRMDDGKIYVGDPDNATLDGRIYMEKLNESGDSSFVFFGTPDQLNLYLDKKDMEGFKTYYDNKYIDRAF